MPYFSKEDVAKARKMDLLTFLQARDPGELVHVYGNTYCTRSHDSLKISNGKWMWWSRGFGGASALDYLMKVRGYHFAKAVGIVLGQEALTPSVFSSKKEETASKRLLLPDKSPTSDVVISYLKERGIDLDIITTCIAEGLLFEALPNHACVFVGHDEDGIARYGNFRATTGEKIMGEIAGSNKAFSFRLEGQSNRLHIFESAIDVLSYATICKITSGNWREDTMLSLGGVYVPSLPGNPMKTPIALLKHLKRSNTKGIVFHLDNDFVGREATKRLTEKLEGEYKIRDEPPSYGKDCNDELLHFGSQFAAAARKEKFENAR